MKTDLVPSKKPLFKRCKKADLEALIDTFCGNVYDIAEFAQCSCRQVYNAVDHYGLRDYLGDVRLAIIDKAESVVRSGLNSDDEETRLKTAQFILERFGKNRGWSKNPEVQQQINVQGDCDIKSLFGIT